MLNNQPPSDRAALIGVIDPASHTAGTPVYTAWIDMKLFGAALVTALVGDVAATGTVDIELEQATDASGTGSKTISGKSITQLGATDDNKQTLINLRSEELDTANDFTHFRVKYTPTTAASIAGVAVLGMDPRYAPASDNDLASVAQIVS